MGRFFSFFLMAVVLLSCSGQSDVKGEYPNVVLIITDDQGWGDLGINGNTNIETPNIDKLAKTGVTFDRFYVCPVCSPTRAELLTGRFHVRGGVHDTSSGGERLDTDETIIAEFFKKAGYATAAYGKWHNGMQPPYHPNARGFDDYYGFCSGHWGNYFNPMLEHNGETGKGRGFTVDDFTNHGIQFINENRDRPFFLYLAFNTPHSPMQVPDLWWDKYKNRELQKIHRDPEKEDINFTRAALAMCENIDWNAGRIVEAIEQSGLSRNTLFVYLSDNGPNSWRWNGGMKGRKGSTDEGGVRVPMIMKWEGTLAPGSSVSQIAGVTDLLPTLADLTGIEFDPPKPLDGVSLKPLLLEDDPEWNDRFIFSYWAGKTSVRSQKFRLDAEGQLFDMESDPEQRTNVSAVYPEIAEQMTRAAEKWKDEVLTEMPVKDTRPFTIGHPGFPFTQIPARDGIPHGNITRSNRWPNDSFFTNWTSTSDSITWDAEVLAGGDFEVEIYYTCPPEDVGSTFELSFAGEKLTAKITQAHNPPLLGMENDRVERMESYVKDFKPMKAGIIHLNKGKGHLTLRATDIPGSQAMDFRLIMFRRI
jgi:arylsulfatase A-like enzyme